MPRISTSTRGLPCVVCWLIWSRGISSALALLFALSVTSSLGHSLQAEVIDCCLRARIVSNDSPRALNESNRARVAQRTHKKWWNKCTVKRILTYFSNSLDRRFWASAESLVRDVRFLSSVGFGGRRTRCRLLTTLTRTCLLTRRTCSYR